MGFKSHEFIIGTVARFDPLKDHSNLLQALALVAKQKIYFRSLLVGKNISRENVILVDQIYKLGLQDRVLLVGQRSDIHAVMNSMDLHVLSSCSEAFPNVIAEAMACGIPCISTDVGDALEIVGSSSMCCQPNNSQALADLIINMAKEWQENPASWQARKALSSRRITERFSIERMANMYEACWLGTVR